MGFLNAPAAEAIIRNYGFHKAVSVVFCVFDGKNWKFDQGVCQNKKLEFSHWSV